jgi:Fe-S-cluster containining protein
MKIPPYFKEGVQFECQGSGKCCISRGEYGHVFLTLEDRKRMAKSLEIKLSEFTKNYCHKADGFWAIKDNSAGPECLFLKDNKCSIYKGRPTQCRTWPFWPDVMNARSWRKDVSAFCPGVGKGRTYSYEEMSKFANEQQESEIALIAEKKK